MASWLFDSTTASKLKDVGSSLSSAGQGYLSKVSSLRKRVAGRRDSPITSTSSTSSSSSSSSSDTGSVSPPTKDALEIPPDDTTPHTPQEQQQAQSQPQAVIPPSSSSLSQCVRLQRNFERLLSHTLLLIDSLDSSSSSTSSTPTSISSISSLRHAALSKDKETDSTGSGMRGGRASSLFMFHVSSSASFFFGTGTGTGSTGSGVDQEDEKKSDDERRAVARKRESKLRMKTEAQMKSKRREERQQWRLTSGTRALAQLDALFDDGNARRKKQAAAADQVVRQVELYYCSLRRDLDTIKSWQYAQRNSGGLDDKDRAILRESELIQWDSIPQWVKELQLIGEWLAGFRRPPGAVLGAAQSEEEHLDATASEADKRGKVDFDTMNDAELLQYFKQLFGQADESGDEEKDEEEKYDGEWTSRWHQARHLKEREQLLNAFERRRRGGLHMIRLSERLRLKENAERERKEQEARAAASSASSAAEWASGTVVEQVAPVLESSLAKKSKASDRRKDERKLIIDELNDMVSLLHSNVSGISDQLRKDAEVGDTLEEKTEESFASVGSLNHRLTKYVEASTGWTCTMFLMIVFIVISFVWTFLTIYIV